MAGTQIQTRRGTTAQHSTFTGAVGELTVDTDKKTVVVHNGITPGGFPLVTSDASGNVGIGTSSPDAVLRISSDATGTDFRSLSTKAGIALNNSGSGISYYDSDTTVFRASTSGGSTENMRINAAGNVALQGNISVGGAAPTTVGTGVTFPAAQSASSNANTLDDYEEGTWVPVTSAGIVFVGTATKSGFYTKIGNVVKATFYLQGVTSVTIAAASTVSLPFITYGYDMGQSTSFGGAIAPVGLLAVNSTSTVQYLTAMTAIPNIIGTVTYTTTT